MRSTADTPPNRVEIETLIEHANIAYYYLTFESLETLKSAFPSSAPVVLPQVLVYNGYICCDVDDNYYMEQTFQKIRIPILASFDNFCNIFAHQSWQFDIQDNPILFVLKITP
jgi:hypothetical protein